MDTISITVDGRTVAVPPESTLLAAARAAGVRVPSLCHHPDQEVKGLCRICVVEVEGTVPLQPACATQVRPGMVIRTNSPRVRQARRINLELILSRHPQDCLHCSRSGNCTLQSLANDLGIREVRFPYRPRPGRVDRSTPALVRNPEKCVLCRRCVETCREVQGVGALFPAARGSQTYIAAGVDEPLAEVACALCGQCSVVCPTGAIVERDDTARVWAALDDAKKHVVVQTAPAVRVALSEAFGLPPGQISTGQMVAALRRLGFDRVFDTNFTADLTILEEASELIHRLQNGGRLPLITSCSPGWVKYAEHFWPEMLENLSTCKSPQQMFGAVAKTYYAQKMGIDPKDMVVVSLMPCTAKKFEAQRPEMSDSGYADVDIAITTRELARMMRQVGLDFAGLPEEGFDDPFGISTGAAAIFGATGGVMEAALRTAAAWIDGEEISPLTFTAVRGLDGVREATVKVGGLELRVAVTSGLANAGRLLDSIRSGEAAYHFVEIMACPGGCIGGGGQPITPYTEESLAAVRVARAEAIYAIDQASPIRRSHHNPAIQELYREFLGVPLSERAHHLLHTHYHQRPPLGIRPRRPELPTDPTGRSEAPQPAGTGLEP